jgi:hypothetical protein
MSLDSSACIALEAKPRKTTKIPIIGIRPTVSPR